MINEGKIEEADNYLENKYEEIDDDEKDYLPLTQQLYT